MDSPSPSSSDLEMPSVRSLRLLATLITLAAPLVAQPIIAQSSGLPSPDRVIDFGANLFPNFTPISTQIPGITVRHASYFTTGTSNNLVGGFLTNDFSGPPNTLSIAFNTPIRNLSFVYHQISTAQASVFRALRGGNVVDSFSLVWNQTQPNNYFGFTNIVFDELQIDFVSDFNVDTLAINDVTADCTVRNGTNVNPRDYSCTTLPVIGTNWQAAIATNANTVGTLVAIAPGGPHPGIPFLGGEILFQLSPAPIILAVAPSFSFPIPPQRSGIGVVITTQGIRVDQVGPTVRVVLLNALDLRLGL